MKLACRLADPLGECGSDQGGLLNVVELEAAPELGPRSYRAGWTWTGCAPLLPLPLGAELNPLPVFFKLYTNGALRATVGAGVTEHVFSLADDENPVFAVVVVGPGNGDAAYDPSFALDALPGNRIRVTFTPPADSDLDELRLYWDGGTGTVDYVTPLTVVTADGSANYIWTSAPLANGTYKLVVRAVDAAGNEDANTTVASIAIAGWPAAPTALTYAYDAEAKKVTLTFTSAAAVKVYSNGGAGEVDYSTPVASGQTNPWLSGVLTGPGTFRFAVRADDGTFEEKNLVYVEFELDAAEVEVNRPNSPFNLAAAPAAGGAFTITGEFDPRIPAVKGRRPAAATHVHVYSDAGTGTMDWNTPVGSASFSAINASLFSFSFTSAAFSHGLPVQFGARAATAADQEDANAATASAVADAQAPAAPTGLTLAAVRDTGGSG